MEVLHSHPILGKANFLNFYKSEEIIIKVCHI